MFFNFNKTIVPLFVLGLLSLFIPKTINAQERDYVVEQFNSDIVIQRDTSVKVSETLIVNFLRPRHGIYRDIPVNYSAGYKTIKADFELLSIEDEEGRPYKYTVSKNRQSRNIRIGDPDIFVEGEKTYVITYELNDIIQSHEEYLELYWNVTGHEWDTNIKSSNATVLSEYANIAETDCFSGKLGTDQKFCRARGSGDQAYFSATGEIYPGNDFTIIVALDKQNELVFPGILEKGWDNFFDNIGYFIAIAPFMIIVILWYRRGRDKRYVSDNVYFTPENTETQTTSVFGRKFLPMVYHPIDDLTPGEVGTIIDEKVHMSDVIAEILELARLGYMKIQKIKKKGLIFSSDEYAFIKTKKTAVADGDVRLTGYQKYLLKEIFRKSNVLRSVKEADDIFEDSNELEEVRKQLSNYDYVLLSGLKNHFYEGLPVFKNKIYESLDRDNIFRGNPEKTRQRWIAIYLILQGVFVFFLVRMITLTGNYYPIFIAVLSGIIGIIFALSMPGRSAKGYSLKRQAEGLKWYLEKGKWRHDYSEKKLFIEEMLPFAVAMGVVDQLVGDMKELGIKPPSYFGGATVSSFTNDLSNFSSYTSSSLTSSPKSSGSSSWSGGSGFSGGSSGGGFGGGGGGSW